MEALEHEAPTLEKIDGAIVFINCALSFLVNIDLKKLDITNGTSVSRAIEELEFRKKDLKAALDDLKLLEGREPWQNSDT